MFLLKKYPCPRKKSPPGHSTPKISPALLMLKPVRLTGVSHDFCAEDHFLP